MNLPLMPKATAVWLIDNTSLTFEQIAEFCGLHPLEVQSMSDGEVAKGIIGIDPVSSGQLTRDEIERCQRDQNAKLRLSEHAKMHAVVESKSKKSKYTPVARRQDKPDAVAWILKHLPEVSDLQIVKMIGTTKATIESIRDKSHWNFQNIKPKDPVLLGICSQSELDSIYEKAKKRAAVLAVKNQEDASKELDEKISEEQ